MRPAARRESPLARPVPRRAPGGVPRRDRPAAPGSFAERPLPQGDTRGVLTGLIGATAAAAVTDEETQPPAQPGPRRSHDGGASSGPEAPPRPKTDIVDLVAGEVWGGIGIGAPIQVPLLQRVLRGRDEAPVDSCCNAEGEAQLAAGQLLRAAHNTVSFVRDLQGAVDAADEGFSTAESPEAPTPAPALGAVFDCDRRSASGPTRPWVDPTGRLRLVRFETRKWDDRDAAVREAPLEGRAAPAATAVTASDWLEVMSAAEALRYPRAAHLMTATTPLPPLEITGRNDAAARVDGQHTQRTSGRTSSAVNEVLLFLLWVTLRYDLVAVSVALDHRRNRFVDVPHGWPAVDYGVGDALPPVPAVRVSRSLEAHTAAAAREAERIADAAAVGQLRRALARAKDPTAAELEAAAIRERTLARLEELRANEAESLAHRRAALTEACGVHPPYIVGLAGPGQHDAARALLADIAAVFDAPATVERRGHACQQLGEVLAMRIGRAPCPATAVPLSPAVPPPPEGELLSRLRRSAAELSAAIHRLHQRGGARAREAAWNRRAELGLTEEEVAQCRQQAASLKAAVAVKYSLASHLARAAQQHAAARVPSVTRSLGLASLVCPDDGPPVVPPLLRAVAPYAKDTLEWQEAGGRRPVGAFVQDCFVGEPAPGQTTSGTLLEPALREVANAAVAAEHERQRRQCALDPADAGWTPPALECVGATAVSAEQDRRGTAFRRAVAAGSGRRFIGGRAQRRQRMHSSAPEPADDPEPSHGGGATAVLGPAAWAAQRRGADPFAL